MTILDDIVALKRKRLAIEKQELPLFDIQERLKDMDDVVRNFASALRGPHVRIIAEIKRASPSEGVIRDIFDPRPLAQDYSGGGAAAISVLTEEDYIQGDLLYIKRARSNMPLPVLRKDFLVEPYQIYQARLFRADAVLLIATILDDDDLRLLLDITHQLGMMALVETHDEYDVVRALHCGASIIGINNRNLKTMEISLAQTERLAKMIPPGKILVSESGIHSKQDIQRVAEAGVDAVLIGTMLMKSDLPGNILRKLIDVPADPQRRKR
ncbi:MAG: indole-3-glycerol phosphate synthase TrpC [Armatimonadia bacterium]